MKYKFRYMTTEALEDARNQLAAAIDEKLDEMRYLREELTDLRKQRHKAQDILNSRSKSKYNGEYYVCSEFRMQYKKPFRELTAEEKHDYHKKYWERYLKARRKKKEKENTDD